MQRRRFIQTTGVAMAGAALSRSLFAQSSRSPATTGGRLVFPLNRGWKYSREASKASVATDFDDSSFEQVVLPHANVRLPWHGFDDREYEFTSLYRRNFHLPPEAKGKHIFVDFEGVMTASAVWINGSKLGEYRGGYTPFSFDLTAHINWNGSNVLAVQVDSSEPSDIPPFGNQIDYLTFGGIYREVALRIVDSTFIENIFALPKNVLSSQPGLDVDCYLQQLKPSSESLSLEVSLLDREGGAVLAQATQKISLSRAPATDPPANRVELNRLQGIKLWDLASPHLYLLKVRLMRGNEVVDSQSATVGFRQAGFTDHGFEINGKVVKLRGLDRHQTFPFVGQAMPARVQRRDAEILRSQLKCNIVRTSHYPQSRHFLNACDELGLLVLEEIPGWQHIGDEAWKKLSIDNLSRMIRRDWNHPSVILWGVRINESPDDHDFYVRTNELAHHLDPTRQTGGIRYFQESEFLEDVFTMNDFGFPLQPPNHPRYLNTEFAGHTFPTKTTDNADRHIEHTVRHARVHDQLAGNAQYAGGIGWCAFDYATHFDFGSGDRICYHGVTDIFREPKPASGFYKSQCDPTEEVVLEPAFHWSNGDESGGLSKGMYCSNCDHLKFYVGDKLVLEAEPDRKQFPHLLYAPFTVNFDAAKEFHWGDLKVAGFIGDKLAITKHYSGRGVDQKFALRADDARLLADGADTTRVVMRVTDEFGNIRPFANDPVTLELQGPAEIIGDNPFVLVGGTGAIWIRAREQAGSAKLKASHPRLGHQEIEFEITPSVPETV